MNLTGFQNLQQQGLELELAFRRQVLQDPTSQQGFNSGSYPQSHMQLPSGDQISSGGYLKNFDHFQSLQTPFLKSPSTFLEPVDQQMNLLLRNDSLLNNPSFQQQNHLYLQQQQQQHQQYNQLQFHQQQQQQSQLWAHQQQLYQDQQQRLLLLQKQQEQQYLEQQHQFKQILQTQQQQLLQLQQQTRHLQNQFQTQVSSSNLINLNPLHTEIPQQFQQQKYLPLQQESFFKPQQFQFGLYEQYKQGQQTPNQLFHHSIPMQLTKKVSEDTLGTQQILQMQKIEEPSDVTLLNLTATPKSLYDTDQRQSAQETYLDLGSRQEEIKGNILKSAKSILGIKEKEDNFLSNQCLELSKPEISSSQRDQQQSTSSIPTQVLTVQNSINQLKQDDNSKTSRWISSQNQLELDVLKKQQKKNIDNSSQDKIKQQREQQRVDEEKIQIDEQVQLEDDSHGKSKKEGNQKQQQQYEQKQGKFQKKRREIKPYKIVKLKTLPKEDQLRNYILAQETKNVSKNICLRLSKFASAEKTKFSSISKLREYLLRNSDRDDARNMINYLQYEFLIDIAHQTRNKTKIIYAKYRLKFINGLKDLENFKQLKF